MNNIKIRNKITRSGLRYWEVARQAGISPYTLSIWLRDELSGIRLKRIEDAIAALNQGGGAV